MEKHSSHEEKFTSGELTTKDLTQVDKASKETKVRRLDKSTSKSFPEKVLKIIENPENQHVIWWNQAGTAICISPKEFYSHVLEKQFQGTKFDSFARRLTRHGFSRITAEDVPPGTHVYYHDCFIRGKPELIDQMKGGKKFEPPAITERKRPREQVTDGTSGMITLSSLYSSNDNSNQTRLNTSTNQAILREDVQTDHPLESLPSSENASLETTRASLLNQQLSAATNAEIGRILSNRFSGTANIALPTTQVTLSALGNEAPFPSSASSQIQQQVLYQRLQENQQQQEVQMAFELAKRRLMLDLTGQRELYRGSGLPLPATMGLLNFDSLRASERLGQLLVQTNQINTQVPQLQFPQQGLSSNISLTDHQGRPLDSQTLQLQILRETMRQNELLRISRGNL